MDILLSLHKLLAYYRRNRQIGHTTFARSIAAVGGVVICANEKEANDIGRKQMRIGVEDQKPTAIALERVMDLDGRMPVPSVLDNHTVMIICEKAIDRIMTQDDYIQSLRQNIQDLERKYAGALKAKDEQIASWKRIARWFRYSNPNYAPAHIAKRRR